MAVSGDTLAVGAYSSDISGNANQGSVYIFKRNGTVWTQQQKFTSFAIDGLPNDNFGISVAISGNTVAVGASGVDNSRGSAYVYIFNGTSWVQQAKLSANDRSAGDNFGYSVALSGDTLVAGAFRDGIGSNSQQGSAYVFTRSGSSWAQLTKLTANGGAAYDQQLAVNGGGGDEFQFIPHSRQHRRPAYGGSDCGRSNASHPTSRLAQDYATPHAVNGGR